jgi:hypothetical protein
MERQKFLLAFGLDFNLPTFKLDFYKYYSSFENLANRLRTLNLDIFSAIHSELKDITNRYFHNFQPNKVFSAIVTLKDLKLLKSLGSNSAIVITKPDKGRGVVIVNKDTYISSVSSLISDPSKFRRVTEPIEKISSKIEDKINRFLLKLKNSNLLTDDIYKKTPRFWLRPWHPLWTSENSQS